ncbi:MAG: S41 family peptidase [Candidatus Obscuribacterales bacterium]|nr:S41 family peptidase [Candidatus Obscuribacterales bacterium]
MFERKRAARIGGLLSLSLLFFGLQQWLLTGERHNQNEQRVLVADNSGAGSLNLLAQSTPRTAITPTQQYNKAWRIIKDGYYDQKFNGQDWSRWEHHYDGKLKTSDDAHKGIETMLASLSDPYTRFLDRDAFDEEKSQIEAHLFGVGMQLGMNKGHKVVVIAPIEGTPASKANVQPGDEITEVDGKPVQGQSLDVVVKQIRGAINTKVSITFMRKTEKRKVDLNRAEIPIRAIASTEKLPDNIGYIRLDSFISQKANKEMRDSLKKLADCDGLIIDLRNNPGGLLANAIDIANMLLLKKNSIIVSTIDSDGYKNSTPAMGEPLTRQPLVVLINGGSASASEILSGALRDNNRAKLVGQKSFGKGLVQAINRLEDGSGINVTIARYVTPNDTDIHKVGIVPDFKVDLKEADYTNGKGPWWIDVNYSSFKHQPADGKDIQLSKAIEVMKEQIHKTTDTTASATTATPKN